MNLTQETTTGATFSPCRQYRYTLWRRWSDGPMLAFIGLNPSTADETVNDPTVRRCINFATRDKCGGMMMLNLFAFRATDPKVMKAEPEPVGPHNDSWILRIGEQVERYVCCWGTHGVWMKRGEQVFEMIEHAWTYQVAGTPAYHLGLTKDGHPKHPLYLRADTQLVRWF